MICQRTKHGYNKFTVCYPRTTFQTIENGCKYAEMHHKIRSKTPRYAVKCCPISCTNFLLFRFLVTQLRTPRSFEDGTLIAQMRLLAREEVLTPDATAIAHASENAAFVVESDWRVELSDIALIHDNDTIISNDSLQGSSQCIFVRRYYLLGGHTLSLCAMHINVFPLKPRTIVFWIF